MTKNTQGSELREEIICAAVRSSDGQTIFGKRHSDCIFVMHALGIDLKNRTEGFYTSEREFVTRKQAMAIAIEAGQMDESHRGAELYSEDLW